MSKQVAILQSNYIPWKGYFDIINKVDVFIFHDDLQYTKQDWRNRNRIKTAHGPSWLTIPCGSDENRLICEVELADHSWQKKHWQKIMQNYLRTPYFELYRDFFEDFYLNHKWKSLSDLNQVLIQKISRDFLGIKTSFEDSRKYDLRKRKADRVFELLKKAGATGYLSGPSAKGYLSKGSFEAIGIELVWMNYDGYREYDQLHPPFAHNVSIIDLLFNVGDRSSEYLLSFAG